jgi:hypothetical protein
MLPWSHVDERMSASMHYWISTTGPSGAPHARPIDGMWLDGTLYFGGDPESRWKRNLDADPRACVTLENAEQAVILHGRVRTMRPDADLAVRLADASNAKYNMGQTAKDYIGEEVLAFSPRSAFAWKLLYKDATRWRWSKTR